MLFTDIINNIITINPRYEFIVAIITAVFVLYSIDTVIRFIITGIETLIYRGKK